MLRRIIATFALLALGSCGTAPPIEREHSRPQESLPRDDIGLATTLRQRATRVPAASKSSSLTESTKSAGSRLTIRAVDVGAGNCIAIQCPNSNEVLLADCGTNEGVHDDPPKVSLIDNRANRAEIALRDFIGNRTVNVIVSHPHTDHEILLPAVLENKDVTGIWLGGYIKEYQNKTDLPERYFIRNWLKAQEKKGVPIHSNFDAGYDSGGMQEPNLTCGTAKVSILTVNAQGSKNKDPANSRSLVTSVRFGNFQAVFPGDAEDVTENDVLDEFSGELKDTTVLFSAHHGARTEGSNSKPWAVALKPQMVVYSAGTQYGHPTCDAVNRFRQAGGLIAAPAHPFVCGKGPIVQTELSEYVTERNGVIEISTDGKTFDVTCSKEDC